MVLRPLLPRELKATTWKTILRPLRGLQGIACQIRATMLNATTNTDRETKEHMITHLATLEELDWADAPLGIGESTKQDIQTQVAAYLEDLGEPHFEDIVPYAINAIDKTITYLDNDVE